MIDHNRCFATVGTVAPTVLNYKMNPNVLLHQSKFSMTGSA